MTEMILQCRCLTLLFLLLQMGISLLTRRTSLQRFSKSCLVSMCLITSSFSRAFSVLYLSGFGSTSQTPMMRSPMMFLSLLCFCASVCVCKLQPHCLVSFALRLILWSCCNGVTLVHCNHKQLENVINF